MKKSRNKVRWPIASRANTALPCPLTPPSTSQSNRHNPLGQDIVEEKQLGENEGRRRVHKEEKEVTLRTVTTLTAAVGSLPPLKDLRQHHSPPYAPLPHAS
jgi:hypothetical protein